MPRQPSPRTSVPIDREALERLAIRYVERFATSRAKLSDYLRRKLRERGWAEETPPPVEEIVERCAAAGYVDDLSFAQSRARSLVRRGYGGGRVDMALRGAGIDRAIAQEVAPEAAELFSAAETFARRRRIGPFAEAPAEPDQRRRQLAAMIRAGHAFDLARRFVDAPPGDVPIIDG